MKTLIAFLLLCVPLSAQDIQYVQTLHDKIPIYGSWLPTVQRRATFDQANDNETVWIPEGETITITQPETALDVVVYGTLVIDHSGCLNVRTLQVIGLSSELQLIETEHGPRERIVFRDLPLDTEHDPAQYGNGLVVIDGRLSVLGSVYRQPFALVGEQIHTGDTTITLSSKTKPFGWRSGDVIVIPDTRQPSTGAEIAAHTEKVTIKRVLRERVVLEQPVQYDHLGWHNQDGTVGRMFDIGILTQPVVIRSENPSGVRGHVLLTRNADIEVRGVACVELGRTTFHPLASTTFDSQGNVIAIGTNQIGRYAWHHHHLLGRENNGKPYQYLIENFAIDGSPKWGVAIHGSYFGRVAEGVVYNCAGAAIVTEAVNEYGNEIVGNMLVGKQPGSGQRITERAGRNMPSGDHWHDRVGLGLESAMNTIRDNRIYGCKEAIGMAGFGTSNLYRPLVRGVCPECDPANRESLIEYSGLVAGQPKRYPFVFPTTGNQSWGCWRGIETWTANCYPDMPEQMFPGYTIVHTRYPTDFEDQTETATFDWNVLLDFTKINPCKDDAGGNTFGIAFKDGYEFGHTHTRLTVRGADCVYRSVFPSEYVRFYNCNFECPIIMYEPLGCRASADRKVCVCSWENCEFLPVNGQLVFAAGQYPKFDIRLWIQQKPIVNGVGGGDRDTLLPRRYQLRPWRDGRTLDVFHYEQHPSFEMAPITDPTKAYEGWPAVDGNGEPVDTQRQLIQLGKPIFGDAVPASGFQSPEFGVFWAADSD